MTSKEIGHSVSIYWEGLSQIGEQDWDKLGPGEARLPRSLWGSIRHL